MCGWGIAKADIWALEGIKKKLGLLVGDQSMFNSELALMS